MTIGGVVNHLRWVEHSWVEARFVGGPDRGSWTDESPDQEFLDGATLPLDEVLAGWVEQARLTTRSRGRPRRRRARGPHAPRCAGCCSTWSRRTPATTATSTCSASCTTAPPATRAPACGRHVPGPRGTGCLRLRWVSSGSHARRCTTADDEGPAAQQPDLRARLADARPRSRPAPSRARGDAAHGEQVRRVGRRRRPRLPAAAARGGLRRRRRRGVAAQAAPPQPHRGRPLRHHRHVRAAARAAAPRGRPGPRRAAATTWSWPTPRSWAPCPC